MTDAVDARVEAALATEYGDAAACLAVAKHLAKQGDAEGADRWARRVVDGGDDPTVWPRAARLLAAPGESASDLRTVKVALTGSWTLDNFAPLLRLACAARGIGVELTTSGFGLYRQELLDPGSDLAAAEPDLVVLAAHDDELDLPDVAGDPGAAVATEAARWTSLWPHVVDRLGARLVQHTFAVPRGPSLGHLAVGVPGTTRRTVPALNETLALAAPPAVAFVDVERVVAELGEDVAYDDRYWYLSKQAFGPAAQPALARHTAAVIAGQLGLTSKCLVLDLDNTLWGGVIGEDGLDGIRLAGTPDGEAFVAVQRWAKALKDRGIVLAVCSKNDDHVAREPFERHPDMVLGLDDIAVFVANWERKSENLRAIARTLDLGLDSLVFVDDNPVERTEVRRFAPEVRVVEVPARPEDVPAALRRELAFETTTFTEADRARAEQYRARAKAVELEASAGSIEDFWIDLELTATVAPFTDDDLTRVVQLFGKTNQWNLTTRRHGPAEVDRFRSDPRVVHRTVRIADRFADHGLVGVLVGIADDDVLDIDTWLMSCRVIRRTVDRTMLQILADGARRLGCATLRGTYLPTPKNGLVRDMYPDLGFRPVDADDLPEGATRWEIDVDDVPDNPFIRIEME